MGGGLGNLFGQQLNFLHGRLCAVHLGFFDIQKKAGRLRTGAVSLEDAQALAAAGFQVPWPPLKKALAPRHRRYALLSVIAALEGRILTLPP